SYELKHRPLLAKCSVWRAPPTLDGQSGIPRGALSELLADNFFPSPTTNTSLCSFVSTEIILSADLFMLVG
ncbi:hypothetical protein CEJ83_20960, partial [Acinetobacter baumannii]